MAKKKVAKTRMTAVIDRLNIGLHVDKREKKAEPDIDAFTDFTRANLCVEIPITESTNIRLRKAFHKAITHGLPKSKFKASFVLKSGSLKSGNVVVALVYESKNGTPNSVHYELKKQGNNHFFNAGGNPTSLAVGANDIPILITGFEYGKLKPAAVTFKYLNRIMFAILDVLLEEHNFKWTGADRKKLVNGDFSIQTYQVAWYSGDLGGDRKYVLLYIRTIYGGLNATSSYVENASKGLNLNARIWDNHDGNLTLEARSGDKNRSFSLTLYSKDEHPDNTDKQNCERVKQLIRWDCTLNNSFLASNQIKKISDLEKKYIEVCEKDGYDIGFIKYISEKVYSRLKIKYLLTINRESFEDIKNIAQTRTNKYEKMLAEHWFDYGQTFSKDTEGAAFFNIKRERYNAAKKALLAHGLDIEISRSAYEAILKNRADATMTERERGEYYSNTRGSASNSVVTWNELIERDTANAEKFKNSVGPAQGVLKIRKFKPVKITPEKFHIYEKFEEDE